MGSSRRLLCRSSTRIAGSRLLAQDRRTDLSVRQERAILVAVLAPNSQVDWQDPLSELGSLARTAGAKVVDRMIQRREKIDPAYYVGRGKAEELRERAAANRADVIIFDNDLTPAQIRDLEEATDHKIVDRSELILDIFATRARTREARLQVELAQLEYTAPRLRGMWTHLERIAGAGGATGAGVVGGIGTRGPGERQIDIDRHLVRRRVTALKRQLDLIDKRKLRQLARRSDRFAVSLVGYTNAGKSTLMNALTDAGANVEDKLFATLDTRTRKWHLGSGQIALLSDTVGFVRDLPHHLVASFRATLEETIHADLLLHVVDGSSRVADQQIESVNRVLAEIGCQDKRTLVLLNKIDAVTDETTIQIAERRASEGLRISARTGAGLDQLVERIREIMRTQRVEATVRADIGDGKVLAYLDRFADVLDRHYDNRTVQLRVRTSPHRLAKLRELGGEVQADDPSALPS